MQSYELLNTRVHNLDMEETISIVKTTIEQNRQVHHTVVNAGKIVSMQDDLELRESVNQSDIINADGQAVVWASKFLGKPLKERVAGIDLMINLVQLSEKEGYKIFLLGAKQEIVEKVVDVFSNTYSDSIIAGYHNGYFSKKEETKLVDTIANSGANILFVAMSSPMKENFLYRNKEKLSSINLIMGVGGSFDVIAGHVKRAPNWMQDSGLEWFYRFIQEPSRMWKRYLVGNTKFILLVLKEKFM